ncbi:ATP-binding protein [Paraburkholderia sp. CNPSo 3281]|uniref:ATP-binding protein n=1 Tax=Paraburkholderia sp. CNPSo 3281 TaxID=2940933 RepID=UPI0020B8ABB7|nr:ATP-binding protein [Paraburkholderia sp. CNPSo 3281]MCP3720744.1 ATP-binding protein [Paraburkholderia sp. CNPSo 3281]
MGKTEFLRRDLLPAAAGRNYLVAYTNLWDKRSAPDEALVSALAEALEPQGVRAVLAKLGSPVRKLKATARIAGAEGSLEAELGAAGDSGVALREVLRQLDKQKRPLLLVIDEAQVLALADHSDFAHALRAALDVRKDRIKVIFAGSSETTLREMFGRASEPFYNWAALEPFPLLGEEFVAFTVKLLNSMARHRLTLEQGMHAFEELHRTPEFFKRFVERYMLYQLQGDEAALANTRTSVFSDEHFLRQWTELNPADQAVVTMLARGEGDIHGAAGLARLTGLTGKRATKNTAAHALRRLQSHNIVTRLAIGEYRIEDEAFAEWVRRRKGTRT